MKTNPAPLGTLALAVALLVLGWTGCRSTTAEKSAPQPALKPVHSPVPPPAHAAVAPPPAATAPAPPATTPATATPASGAVAATPAETPPPPPPPVDNPPLARVAPQPPADLSPGVQAVVNMVHAQVSVPVLLEYVNTTTNAFHLESDDIVYLKDLGVSDEVVTAMLKRAGRETAPEGPTLAEAAPAPAPPAEPPPASTNATASAATPAPSTYDQTVTPTTPAPQSAQAPPPPPPSAPPVTENYFYSSLAPYGTWLYIEPYGWCWQPTVAVVDRTWRPYLHGGRWVYTSAGWYWQSYYTWGWAPFHYGNWYLSPVCGWVWVPGHVWAPAWVTWRYSDGYCGWAPLPPGCGWHPGFGLTYWGSRVSVSFGFHLGWSSFVFCTWDDWWRPHPWRYCLPPHRAVVVYNQTTIINNFYLDKSRNTIVNEGVPPHAMPTHVRRELRKVELADVPAGNSRSLAPERLTAPGGKLAVYRPEVPPDLKLASAKPGEAPLRPGRVRSDSATPGRTDLAPGRSPENLSGRPTRAETPSAPGPQRQHGSGGADTPARVPQRSVPPGRFENSTRAEVPVRAPTVTTPGRSAPPARAPEATPPSRAVPGATQPTVPTRAEPRAPSVGTPVRPDRSGVTPAPRTAEPRTAPLPTPPTRNPASAPGATPPTRRASESAPMPGRSERPTLTVPPAAPAPAPNSSTHSPTARPESRLQPGPHAPPTRSESVARPDSTPAPRFAPPPSRSAAPAPAPGVNMVPRYVPPARAQNPVPAGSAPVPQFAPPPARSVNPSLPQPAPGRAAAPAAPPAFNPPASRPYFSSPPAFAGPSPRSGGAALAPGRRESPARAATAEVGELTVRTERPAHVIGPPGF